MLASLMEIRAKFRLILIFLLLVRWPEACPFYGSAVFLYMFLQNLRVNCIVICTFFQAAVSPHVSNIINIDIIINIIYMNEFKYKTIKRRNPKSRAMLQALVSINIVPRIIRI